MQSEVTVQLDKGAPIVNSDQKDEHGNAPGRCVEKHCKNKQALSKRSNLFITRCQQHRSKKNTDEKTRYKKRKRKVDEELYSKQTLASYREENYTHDRKIAALGEKIKNAENMISIKNDIIANQDIDIERIYAIREREMNSELVATCIDTRNESLVLSKIQSMKIMLNYNFTGSFTRLSSDIETASQKVGNIKETLTRATNKTISREYLVHKQLQENIQEATSAKLKQISMLEEKLKNAEATITVKTNLIGKQEQQLESLRTIKGGDMTPEFVASCLSARNERLVLRQIDSLMVMLNYNFEGAFIGLTSQLATMKKTLDVIDEVITDEQK
jgi:hypothetical protein